MRLTGSFGDILGTCGHLLTEHDVKRVLEAQGYDVVCLPVDRFPSGGLFPM